MCRYLSRLARILLPVCLLTADGAIADPDRLPPDFESLILQVQQAFEIPGMAVVVVKDGEVLLAEGFGQRAMAGKRVNARTRFPIASNTKAFTAAAVALLVEDGLLAWDTPVIEYLPDFALSNPYVTANITVRDLLVHNSGLPLGAGDLLWWPHTTHTRDEAIRRLRYLPLERSFRQGYAYDNVLYGVAGKLIEVVSEQRLADFVAARILEPLDMKDSRMQFPGSVKRGNTARPHAKIDGQLQIIDAFESGKTDAPGGLQVSARDMAKWLSMHLSQGMAHGDDRLLTAESVRQLHTVVTPMPIAEPPCDIEALRVQFRGYALGLAVEDYRGRKIIRHGGGLPGFVSEVLMLPEQNLGVAVMTNQQVRAGITVLVSNLLDHFLDLPTTDWLPIIERCHTERMEKFLAAKQSAQAERIANTSALPSATLINRYNDAWYGDIEIRELQSGTLELEFMHTPALIGDMEHWHYNTWIVRWRDAPLPPNNIFVTFALDAKGEVASATMKPVSPFTDFSYNFTHLKLIPQR